MFNFFPVDHWQLHRFSSFLRWREGWWCCRDGAGQSGWLRCGGGRHRPRQDFLTTDILTTPFVNLYASPWTVMMVTLITEQLRKQSLEEPYHKAFSFNSTVVSWKKVSIVFWTKWVLWILFLRASYHICYSHYLQWAPVLLSHGANLAQFKVSSNSTVFSCYKTPQSALKK